MTEHPIINRSMNSKQELHEEALRLRSEGLPRRVVAQRTGLSVALLKKLYSGERGKRAVLGCLSGDCGRCVACEARTYAGERELEAGPGARASDPSPLDIRRACAAIRRQRPEPDRPACSLQEVATADLGLPVEFLA